MLAGWSAVAAGVRAFDIVEAAKAARGDAQGTAGVFASGVEAGDAFSSDFLHRLFPFLQVLIDRVHYTPKWMHCAVAVD